MQWLFRSGSPVGFLLWLVVMLLWWFGGWGLLGGGFEWKTPKYRAATAWGVGLVVYLLLVNLLGRWLSPGMAFVFPAIIVVFGGMFFERNTVFSLRSFVQALKDGWKFWLAWGTLFFLIVEVEFGLELFDDALHIPLISMLARGYIPPVDYLNPHVGLPYHYGFDLFGASLVRIGYLFPWAAFDVGKAILWGYGVILAWVWASWYLQKQFQKLVALGVMVFAGGARYLLLLLPAPLLSALDKTSPLWGTTAATGSTLSVVLTRNWHVDGGPLLSWPVAFLSGISNPYIMGHSGVTTLAVVVFFLVWVVWLRVRVEAKGSVLTALLLGFWALVAETTYVLVLAGSALLLIWGWKKRIWREMKPWIVAVLLSLPLALLQGGVLTEYLLRMLHLEQVTTPTFFAGGFSLRWPPAVVSAHLGPLSVFSPLAWVVAIAEMGVSVVVAPLAWQWGWQRFARGRAEEMVLGVYLVSAMLGFLIPMFVRYSVDRDIARLMNFGVFVWNLFLALALWQWLAQEKTRWLGKTTAVALCLISLSGVVLGALQLTAIQHWTLGKSITRYDAIVAKQAWGALPKNALVFGPEISAVAVTGNPTYYGALDHELPVHKMLMETPALEDLRRLGFDFVYVPFEWWRRLSPQAQKALQAPCVSIVAASPPAENMDVPARWLIDIRQCALEQGEK